MGFPVFGRLLTNYGNCSQIDRGQNRLHKEGWRPRHRRSDSEHDPDMDSKRLTGPQAGVVKYDLLTALSVAGLHGTQGFQTSMLRLVALITARYNWRADELTVGQREMARLWDCNERTVKREIKRLTEAGLLKCLRPGVRGRVSAYRLDQGTIVRLTQDLGHAVGPDFVERMAVMRPDPATVVRVDFGATSAPEPPEENTPGGGGAWRHVMRRLKAEEPSLFTNWFSKMEFEACAGGELRLRAKTRFIARYVETRLAKRLVLAAEAELGPVDRLVVKVDPKGPE